MKKLIALVLALVCVLALAGCSNGSIKGIGKAHPTGFESISIP